MSIPPRWESSFPSPSVKFAADGSRIALVGDEGMVRIVAVKSGRRIAEFPTRSRSLTGLAFSPDGQTLLTTSLNSSVCLWEVATGQLVRKLEPGTYLYSPSNRLLAGAAGTLRVSDLYTGQVIRDCKADGYSFGNFAFSPDSRRLAATCSDTTILVWPTSGADPTADALDEKQLRSVLETGRASEAYEAIGRTIADPERALPFLERWLRPAARLDVKDLDRLIAGLESDQPNQRETATRELARLGASVEPALRAALSSDKVPVGAKRQIESLLQDMDEKPTAVSPEDFLHIRGIQALERIGTERARKVLKSIAQGEEMSPRTRAAVEALRRTEGR